jgi:hypothetical protein
MNTTHENICNITFNFLLFFFGVQDNNCGSEVSLTQKKEKIQKKMVTMEK